jgi:hypothetical protein
MLRQVLVEGGEDDVDLPVALGGLRATRLDHADAELDETALETAKLRDPQATQGQRREDHPAGVDVRAVDGDTTLSNRGRVEQRPHLVDLEERAELRLDDLDPAPPSPRRVHGEIDGRSLSFAALAARRLPRGLGESLMQAW